MQLTTSRFKDDGRFGNINLDVGTIDGEHFDLQVKVSGRVQAEAKTPNSIRNIIFEQTIKGKGHFQITCKESIENTFRQNIKSIISR